MTRLCIGILIREILVMGFRDYNWRILDRGSAVRIGMCSFASYSQLSYIYPSTVASMFTNSLSHRSSLPSLYLIFIPYLLTIQIYLHRYDLHLWRNQVPPQVLIGLQHSCESHNKARRTYLSCSDCTSPFFFTATGTQAPFDRPRRGIH